MIMQPVRRSAIAACARFLLLSAGIAGCARGRHAKVT
jgi:hypothetical protein